MKHEGETIIILATGPSIGGIDFSLLENFTTIGINLILDLVETFDPDYHIWADAWVPEDHPGLLEASNAVKICHSRACKGAGRNAIQFESYNPGPFEPVMSDRLEDGLYIGKTTTCAAINLAFIMGAARIIICGLDLSDWGHFYDGRLDSRYSFPGQEFPGAKKIHEDMGRISEYAKSKGVTIINANPRSAVQCFKRMTLPAALLAR